MRFLSVQNVVDLHGEILSRTGGETGILSESILESAVFRHRFGPFHGDGEIIERTAYLLRGIIQDHPFVDGNKRTAVDSSLELLRLNGFSIRATVHEVVAFALHAAQGMPLASMESWLRARAQTLNPSAPKEVR